MVMHLNSPGKSNMVYPSFPIMVVSSMKVIPPPSKRGTNGMDNSSVTGKSGLPIEDNSNTGLLTTSEKHMVVSPPSPAVHVVRGTVWLGIGLLKFWKMV